MARAKKLDKGEIAVVAIPIASNFPLNIPAALTHQRVKPIEVIKLKPLSVSDLALRLMRKARSVPMDVSKPGDVGMVKTHKSSNPRHTSARMVETVAETI